MARLAAFPTDMLRSVLYLTAVFAAGKLCEVCLAKDTGCFGSESFGSRGELFRVLITVLQCAVHILTA